MQWHRLYARKADPACPQKAAGDVAEADNNPNSNGFHTYSMSSINIHITSNVHKDVIGAFTSPRR